jgi:hypothetical protein
MLFATLTGASFFDKSRTPAASDVGLGDAGPGSASSEGPSNLSNLSEASGSGSNDEIPDIQEILHVLSGEGPWRRVRKGFRRANKLEPHVKIPARSKDLSGSSHTYVEEELYDILSNM